MVSDNYTPDQYTWNGLVGYEVNFPFNKTTDLKVTHVSTISETMILNTHYTVTYSNGSWFVTPMTDWEDGSILIERFTPKTQDWKVSSAAVISRTLLETTFNKVVMMIQDLYFRIQELPVYSWVGYALRITDSEGNITDSPILKGDIAEITIGDTITGPAGSDASVVNTGTTTDAVLEFTVPRGKDPLYSPVDWFVGEPAYYLGVWYEAQVDISKDSPITPGTNEAIWKKMISAPGTTYDPGAEYETGQLVWYAMEFWEYINLTPASGQTPAENTYWTSRGTLGSIIKDVDFLIGSVFSYMGSSANIPTGMIGCLGQTLLKTDYPKLWSKLEGSVVSDITTFTIPNMQGVGVRGKGTQDVNGRTKGNASLSEGEIWEDEFQMHIHTSRNYSRSSADGDATNEEEFADYDGLTWYDTSSAEADPLGDGNPVRTGDETHGTDMIVNWIMYVGNGSLSVALDPSIDNRITDLENADIFSSTPYTTGWINLTEWRDISIPVEHGFDVLSMDDLIIDLKFSSDGTDATAIKPDTVASGVSSGNIYGTSFLYVDSNNIRVQTGDLGIPLIDTNGARLLLATQSYYYKVTVRKMNAVSFINAQNAFLNHKDWVEVWGPKTGESAVANASVVKYLPNGSYRVTMVDFVSPGRDKYVEIIVNRDSGDIALSERYQAAGTSENFIMPIYIYATNTLELSKVTYSAQIYKIERWETVTGETKDSVKVSDGFETLWEDWTATSIAKTLPVEDGNYKVTIRYSSSPYQTYSAIVNINSLSSPATLEFRGIWSVNAYLTYTKATGIWTSATSSYNIVKIEKQIGYIALDVTKTRTRITGTPEFFDFLYDTTAGDYDFTSDLANVMLAAEDGDRLSITNTGVVDTHYIENCPNGAFVAAGQTVEWIYNFSDSMWRRRGNYAAEAKAWVVFDGTTNIDGFCTILSSYNVASVTDNGTGDYIINFAHSLAKANYACHISARAALTTATRGGSSYAIKGGTTPSVDAVNINTFINSSDIDAGAPWDHNLVSLSVF